jgi:hypothetical protein
MPIRRPRRSPIQKRIAVELTGGLYLKEFERGNGIFDGCMRELQAVVFMVAQPDRIATIAALFCRSIAGHP